MACAMHKAVLISTYELGRQPFGLASPAAWLRRAGWEVVCLDLARGRLRDAAVQDASLIGFHLPMHTATRLAAPIMERARRLNPSARICAYGLYAPLNADWLRSLGVDDVLGGEFEADLTVIAASTHAPTEPAPETGLGARHGLPRPSGAGSGPTTVHVDTLPRLRFLVPDRSGLLPLHQYATLRMPDGTARVVGATEASRGCKHLCRHCPVVPVYKGQFRVVQAEVVLADIDALAAAGAEHITFGDPDFLNGPTHAMRVVDGLHAAHPRLTYDVTIKIEHLLRHRHLLGRLRETGCLFITSAVESIDDRALACLRKGHTREDFITAAAACRASGLTLVPTFVAFHPWVTLSGYCELLDVIEELDLVDQVAPIQLAIRLLIPQGSGLLDLADIQAVVTGFDRRTLTHQWVHTDPRVDQLQHDVMALVGATLAHDRRTIFSEISAVAHERAGSIRRSRPRDSTGVRTLVPYMSEPWYCCAEPDPEQMRLV
jgi:radical SAM superfamily enzyme YgiQ (UPF0313 family)